jgi:NAD+ synthase (glutamine-hydrolysing)
LLIIYQEFRLLNIKLAGSALNQTPFDWAGNRQRIVQAIGEARKQGSSLICLPELCISGYGCEDAFFYPHVQEKSLESVFSLLAETKNMIVAVGLPLCFRGVLFNVVALLANEKLIGFIPKKSLAGDGVHYEPRWFKAWEPGQVSKIEIRGQTYPIGDLYFDIAGIRVGFEICEEAWVANRPGIALASRGVDLILNPSASHFAFGKLETRRRFIGEGSRAFNVAYVYSNVLGNESGRIVYDGAVLIADQGKIVAEGPRFSFQDVQVSSAVVDIQQNRITRSATVSYVPNFSDSNDHCIKVAFNWPDTPPELPIPRRPNWESGTSLKHEEFTRAVSLALFDFLRKSHQCGFVISLSGGIDSAAVTMLCRTALDYAVQELGISGTKEKLKYIRSISDKKTTAEIAAALITCAYQGTENSSEATLLAAQTVAADAGAVFLHWNVEDILNMHRGIVEKALGETLSWEKDDLTLQNIQARVRGPGIWMVANIKHALLLATSNRSEAAVGYATMDGDTCGGISPIGGIDKNFLRLWSRWMADQGPEGLRNYPSFATVMAQPPTAELRPKNRGQTDEGDLMPYDILDLIEGLAIRDKRSPRETLRKLLVMRPETPLKDLTNWTVKFFRMWCQNQWKRERYAPSFHLDDKNLDPKSWCRFPILSSGFEEELSAMSADAAAR